MFNGKRSFNGRQGEQIYNKELYTLYEILKHFLDIPDNPSIGPKSNLEDAGALWLDMQSNPGFSHLMYKDKNNKWKPIFDDWFKIIKEIKSQEEPKQPEEGQLWIDKNGVLNWFNGTDFVPIKSKAADNIDFSSNAFENFLIIDPLKMTGDYIVENLSKIASTVNGIKKWSNDINYKKNDIIYYTNSLNETIFYRILDNYVIVDNFEIAITNKTVEKVTMLAQYLIPSESLDKLFLEGYYINEKNETDKTDSIYEKVSDVCIQISLDMYQGKAIAAVHINPTALKNIKKRIIQIPKSGANKGIIEVSTDNTEFYALKNGYGTFLNKGIDYKTKANGIQIINNDIINNYNYIYSITYYFETRIKNKGKLLKGTVDLSNQTCIWIGKINQEDNLLVFTQGLCLEDDWYSYDYTDNSGLVKFNGYDENGIITDDVEKMVKPIFETKTDVAIMRFDRKTGAIAFTSSECKKNEDGSYYASITIPKEYKKPLVFVQGEKLSFELKNYTSSTNKKITIDDIDINSSYYIVDAVRNDNFNMFIDSGTIQEDCSITVTDNDLLSGTCQPLVFIDGFYISTKDFEIDENNKIKIHGLTQGQEYVLLKDKLDDKYQLLFDGEVSFTTIPMKESINDALVYVNNLLIVDGNACILNNKKTTDIANNEIKSIISNGVQAWYRYNKSKKVWYKITNESDIVNLDLSTSGYSVETNTISMLQNFGEVKCTYYAYKFSNNIEKPLIKGYTDNYEKINAEDFENMIFYKINPSHSYSKGQNTLSVWMNGIRQTIKEYSIIKNEIINGIEKEVEYQGFLLSIPTDENNNELEKLPTCYYIIEEPEEGELNSCLMENLSEPINSTTYITNEVILTPGIIRMFIDGYRQPEDSYVINNMNSITIIEPVLSDSNNRISILSKNNENKIIEVNSKSNILIEVRKDYKLKEKTVQITEDNIENILRDGIAIFDSETVFAKNQLLPEDLFLSQISEINIFINGACYGKDFSKAKDQDAIILTNLNLIKVIKVNDKITFEWR